MQVGDKDEVQCLEKAEMVREGTDISIFTYSRMRYVVMQAVNELVKKGYNPEVRRGPARPGPRRGGMTCRRSAACTFGCICHVGMRHECKHARGARDRARGTDTDTVRPRAQYATRTCQLELLDGAGRSMITCLELARRETSSLMAGAERLR